MVGCYNFVQVRTWSLTIWTHGMSLLICLHWSIRGLGAPEKWEECLLWAYWNNAEDNGRHRKTSSGLLGVDRGKSLGRGWRTWCRLWMWAALWWSPGNSLLHRDRKDPSPPLEMNPAPLWHHRGQWLWDLPYQCFCLWYEGFLSALVGGSLVGRRSQCRKPCAKGIGIVFQQNTGPPDASWAFEYWC